MKTVTLRDGTKVQVPDNASPATIKRIARDVVRARRPVVQRQAPPVQEVVQAEPRQSRFSQDYELAALRQEMAGIKALNAEMAKTLAKLAAKEMPDHGPVMDRMAGAMDAMCAKPAPVMPDLAPALRELKTAIVESADRTVAAIKADVSIVRDAAGRPVGIKKG